MMIISFAWTTPAIVALQKRCTRRDWNDDYAARFHAGSVLAGYDRNPRFKGKQICVVKLTQKPYRERYCDVPDSDWQAEGFEYLTSIGARVHGFTPRELWDQWKADPAVCYVVRFEIVRLTVEPETPRLSGLEVRQLFLDENGGATMNATPRKP